MNARTMQASVDARVLAALADVPDEAPWEDLRAAAGVSSDDLRASLRRLALRDEPSPEGSMQA